MIAKYRRRVLIIVTAFAIWSLGAAWLIFGRHIPHVLEENRAFYFALALALVLPTFFYYSMAKRMPRYVIGLAVLATGLVLLAVGTVAYFVLSLDNLWSECFFDLGEASLILACLIFIWQGVKASRVEKGTGKSSS